MQGLPLTGKDGIQGNLMSVEHRLSFYDGALARFLRITLLFKFLNQPYFIMTGHEPGEKNDLHDVSKICRVCSSAAYHTSRFSFLGICDRCGYKILIVLFIVLIVMSYTVWFGVF
jgi:hypothetical protein